MSVIWLAYVDTHIYDLMTKQNKKNNVQHIWTLVAEKTFSNSLFLEAGTKNMGAQPEGKELLIT